MAISFVGPASLSHASRTNSTVPLPEGVQVGDYVIVGLIGVTVAGEAPSIDWGGWGSALVTPVVIGSGGDNGLFHVRGKIIDGDDVSAGSVTATHATAITDAAVVAFRPDGPINASATSASGTGTTTTWTGVTLDEDDSAVALLSESWDGGGGLSPPEDYTEAVDIVTAYAAYQLFDEAGATGNPSHTSANVNPTSPWAAVLVALVPEGEGGLSIPVAMHHYRSLRV